MVHEAVMGLAKATRPGQRCLRRGQRGSELASTTDPGSAAAAWQLLVNCKGLAKDKV